MGTYSGQCGSVSQLLTLGSSCRELKEAGPEEVGVAPLEEDEGNTLSRASGEEELKRWERSGSLTCCCTHNWRVLIGLYLA